MSFTDALDQSLWDEYDADGPVLPPNDSPELLGEFAAIQTPVAAAVATETTGDPTVLASRALAAAAVMELFGFNPHQLRGPDGKWVKMPTHLRKERRRERDRARREAKRAQAQQQEHDEPPNDNAPRQMDDSAERRYRDARDRFNREIVDHAQFQANDNDFEGESDLDLDVDLRELKVALVQNDDAGADEIADRLQAWLAGHYQAEVPAVPQRADFDPKASAEAELRTALDEYNIGMQVLAEQWIDMLRDPDEDFSHLGLDAAGLAEVADRLAERVDQLKKNTRDGVPAAADRNAAAIRQVMLVYGLQTNGDLDPVPTLADFDQAEALRLAVPQRKDNPLLTSGSAYADRLAQLQAAVAEGVWGEEPLGQGAMGETKKLLLNDGTQVISKRAKSSWPMGGVDWSTRQQTDAEELSAIVGSALGLRAPAVQRVDGTTINMEYVPNAVPAFNRFYDPEAPEALRVPPDVLSSDDGVRMGLFDVLIGNPDRHGFNWMVDDENRIYPIDNGLAFINIAGTNASDAARSPFAREYFTSPSGQFKENVLSKRDVQWARQQLEDLRPEFERVGQPAWLDQALARLRQVEIRARGGAQHQLPAPRQE